MSLLLDADAHAVAPAAAAPAPSGRRARWRLPVGWPIAGAVAAYPVWWALGVTDLVLPVTAVVLLLQLLRRGRVRVPPGFWLWLLFLALVVLSAVMLNVTAPGTLPPSGTGRYIAYVVRLLDYVAVAVVMLFIGNTTERELPRLRVVTWMSLLAVWVVGLGLLSLALPRAAFTTPLSLVLPSSLSSALDAQGGRVSLAQVQPVLGVDAPRPAAPFVFTNSWGNVLSVLLVWVLVLAWAGGRRTRLATGLLVAASIVPIVYSLNRGMWIGLGLSLAYGAVRLAARGRLLAIGVLALVLGVGAVTFAASPLQTLVAERLGHGHSNDVRGSLARDAVVAATNSPLLGYGTTRTVLGSEGSIAIGKSASCPKCGNFNIGSTGQIFLLLVAQGFLGMAVYVAYFLRTLWEYRRDASPVGIAGSLVVVLSLFYAFFYTALLMPLLLTFVSIGLLWRNATLRAADAAALREGAPRPGTPRLGTTRFGTAQLGAPAPVRVRR